LGMTVTNLYFIHQKIKEQSEHGEFLLPFV